MESKNTTEEMTNRNGPFIPARALTALCVLILAGCSAYFFRGAFNPLNTIDGADSSLWVPMLAHKWTHGLFTPRWVSHFFAGVPQQFYFLSHGLPLILTLSPHRFHGFEFMLDTFLAGAFMFAFLRSRGLGRFGSLVGGLAYQLGNNLLSEASLGGMWKFATAVWVPLFLLFFCKVMDEKRHRMRNSIFAGATLGLQFLGGEVQLTYYVCLLALAYFVFDSAGRLWDSREVKPLSGPLKDEGKRVLWGALCVAIAVVFAAEAFGNYISFAQTGGGVGVRSEEDNWQFVTEFSFPPKETVALALSSRVFGSDEYPLEYQGKPIPRISDDYLGIVVLMFAFMAIFSGNRKAYFFAAAALAALIISYGRFFPPLFRLVYALPVMNGLRNPHKWLYITALCVPVLAGIGADFWKNSPPEKNWRIVVAVMVFFLLMADLAILSPSITGDTVPATLLAQYGRFAILAVATLFCLAGRAKKVIDSKSLAAILPIMILALLAGDLIQNASRFLKYYDYRERYVDDETVQWLLSQSEPFRVKVWSESPYLRYMMTEVLPYHGIGTPDAIVSRRAVRYSHVFEAVREERLPYEKFFQLFNVKYILSSAPVVGAPMPLSPAAAFPKDSGGAPSRGAPSRGTPSKKCYIYELDSFLPRAYVVDRFEVAPPEKIIDLIGGAEFDLHRTVALETRPDLAASGKTGAPQWSVEKFEHAPHRVSMRVATDGPGILVLQEFNDPKWRAHIDGREAEILQANYLMRAVAIPEGAHDVVFTYNPPIWGFVITLACFIATLAVVGLTVAAGLRRRGRNAARAAESDA